MGEGAAEFPGIAPGLRHRYERVVDEALLTTHIPGAGVLATPSMILLMEQASHLTVADRLPEGFTTVGYEVHVRHVAPARAGSTVTVTSELKEVSGKKLLFEVACREGDTLIGEGLHRRAIVPVPQSA